MYVFLQYFDTVGWVFWPVKTVACITYTVLVETLNPAQSNNGPECTRTCCFYVPLLQHSVGQIIRSLVSVCLLSLLQSQFWIEVDETQTVHRHMGARKLRSSSLWVKSDNAFPYFTLKFSPLLMHFQWDGPNTAVSTPVDQLWWLIPHTTPLGSRLGCYGMTSNVSPNSPKYASNAFTTEMYLSNRWCIISQ